MIKSSEIMYKIHRFSNGDKYDGEWRDGKIHGQGIYYHKDGNKYEGEWRDKIHGQGTYYYKTGGKYEGEWRDDKRYGQGIRFYKDGEKYEGEWRNDKRYRQGTFYYKDGTKYEGEWRDDKINGYGRSYCADGTLSYEGEWEEGKLKEKMLSKEEKGIYSTVDIGYSRLEFGDIGQTTFLGSRLERSIKKFKPIKKCFEYTLESALSLGIPEANDFIEDCKEALEIIWSKVEGMYSLTPSEVFAVCSYTFENGRFYKRLNAELRKRDDTGHLIGYLFFLFSGLNKLPDWEGIVYRGIPKKHIEALRKDYPSGQTVVWSAFSSTTSNLIVAKKFAGKGGVVMKIKIHKGKDIKKLSSFTAEDEVLLMPNTKMTVISSLEVWEDYHLIELIEQRKAKPKFDI